MSDRKQTIRLLLVDDEDEFRRSARKVLARQGFEVAEASSGERALELLEEATPDVVVLDLKMAGMDGISTLARLRELRPDLPVVILTGHGQLHHALAGMRLEVAEFVQKPVDLKALAERIRRLLAGGLPSPLREPSVRELMTAVDRFPRLRSDQCLRDLVEALRPVVGNSADAAHQHQRAALVFDEQGRFVGLVRMVDMPALMLPDYLRQSPYSTYFTGMFLAQSKVAGAKTIGDVLRQSPSIRHDEPLMAAVHVMATEHVVDLPVVRGDELVGVLRAESLFRAIADSMLGPEA